MSDPLVSVLIITYNQEKMIGKAIESVLEQKMDFPFELVVGEDCSTDRTREIVAAYQKKHPEIIRMITSDKNVGMMENDRRTFRAARGKYVACCEGDDYWCDPNKLQKQVAVMEADPAISMCFHNVFFRYNNRNRMEKQFKWRFRNRFYPASSVICVGGKFNKPVSVLIRREDYVDLPDWYYEAPSGDWALNLISAFNGKIFYLNDVMAVYRVNVSNSWSDVMYHNPELYKKHLFQAMKTRKMANKASNDQYRKFFGRRIGNDILWLTVFGFLTDEEFKFLQNEYFCLLAPAKKKVILSFRKIRIEKLIAFLRKVKHIIWTKRN